MKESNADSRTIERALNSFDGVFDKNSASDALKALSSFNNSDKKSVTAKGNDLMHISEDRF